MAITSSASGIGRIESILGEEAEDLLGHECTTIARDRLHLPGPDFVDRVVKDSDRPTPVLRSLQSLFSHGRLDSTGYVSILPVDQGIEHSAGASFAKNPDYFDPEGIVKLAIEGGCNAVASTLGVLGMGRIGQALARRARGFNMRVIYHNRSRVAPEIETELNAEYVSKADLLKRADHVVLVLPYTAENHHTIGAAELASMKPTATLTNIARGGIVDDAALIQALRNKTIAAAGLDVFEGEPNFNRDFLTVSNVVLTPHIASATESTRRAMANLAADNLIAALGEGPRAGNPPNPINPEVLKK